MTICEIIKDDIVELKLSHLSKTGHTFGLDDMIARIVHIGKGYGAQTLIEFIAFFRELYSGKKTVNATMLLMVAFIHELPALLWGLRVSLINNGNDLQVTIYP